MPPYLGCSPEAGAWAKASDPPVAARYTSRLIMAAVRTTSPGMRSGQRVRIMRHLVSDVALAHLMYSACRNQHCPSHTAISWCTLAIGYAFHVYFASQGTLACMPPPGSL